MRRAHVLQHRDALRSGKAVTNKRRLFGVVFAWCFSAPLPVRCPNRVHHRRVFPQDLRDVHDQSTKRVILPFRLEAQRGVRRAPERLLEFHSRRVELH